MGMSQSIADMFHVEDPEQAAKLTVTFLAVGVGLSILCYALSILCIAGQTVCCFVQLCQCFKNGGQCCARCFKRGEKGEDSAVSEAGARTDVGQLMSLVVMVVSILVALVWEFYFAEGMDNSPGTEKAWSEGCTPDLSIYPECLKYQAAYRVAFVAFCFFVTMTAVTAARPEFHDQGWDVKLFCYLALLTGMSFAPNRVFDDHGFIWLARVLAFLFLILQQIILIDSAYSVNEYLVEKGYAEQMPGDDAAWNEWLVACLVLSVGIFAAAVVGTVLLFVYFTGCDDANTFVSLTFFSVVAFTVLQLFATKPQEGAQGHNLLTTAVVAGYVVYLTYVAVSANPEEACNPLYSNKENVLSLVMGLGITFVSVTATVCFASKNVTELVSAPPVAKPDLEAVLTGAVGPADSNERSSLSRQLTGSEAAAGEPNQPWRFNLVMALITCYWCCVLTNWGNPGGGASATAPTAGETAMWMNIVASWVCTAIYTWTIVAPILFPDRDFS